MIRAIQHIGGPPEIFDIFCDVLDVGVDVVLKFKFDEIEVHFYIWFFIDFPFLRVVLEPKTVGGLYELVDDF